MGRGRNLVPAKIPTAMGGAKGGFRAYRVEGSGFKV